MQVYYEYRQKLSNYFCGLFSTAIMSTMNFPEENVQTEEVWFTSLWVHRNIAHFLDTMFIYNIQDDNRYPLINHLIMADIDFRETLVYNNMMFKIITNNYKPFKITYQQDLTNLMRKFKHNRICYKTMHIMFRTQNGWLGIFRSLTKRYKFRDEGYKYLKITPTVIKSIKIVLIARKNKRRPRMIVNMNILEEIIKSEGYNYSLIYFDGKTPIEQIKLIIDSNIIITPFGASTVNIMWMSSPKSVIINTLSAFVAIDYVHLSYSLNYMYFPLFSPIEGLNPYTYDIGFEEDYRFEKHPKVFFSTYKSAHYPIYRKFEVTNMTINTKQFKFSLLYAIRYFNYVV